MATAQKQMEFDLPNPVTGRSRAVLSYLKSQSWSFRHNRNSGRFEAEIKKGRVEVLPDTLNLNQAINMVLNIKGLINDQTT